MIIHKECLQELVDILNSWEFIKGDLDYVDIDIQRTEDNRGFIASGQYDCPPTYFRLFYHPITNWKWEKLTPELQLQTQF